MKITAVIPAYNEESTIGEVVRITNQNTMVEEVIVISDGSTDNTGKVAKQNGAKVIELEQNIGKGGAMLIGAMNSTADILLFLDADLIGLTTVHIDNLLLPIINDGYNMTIGVFAKGRFTTDFAQVLTPYLSGQRAIIKNDFMNIDNLEATRFGVEIALTKYIKKHNLRKKEVVLKEMSHFMKEEKLGLLKGFSARMKMYWEIAKWISR